MATYTDEQLEHWGEVFVNQDISDYGVSFEQFLTQPEEYSRKAIIIRGLSEVVETLKHEPDMQQRGSQMISPTRHNAPTKQWKTGRYAL